MIRTACYSVRPTFKYVFLTFRISITFNKQDVQYGDIDYMDRFMDFTVDEINYGKQNLSDFVDELHEYGQRYIIILVSFSECILILNDNNYRGSCVPTYKYDCVDNG